MDVVTASLETTGQDCVRNIDNATKTMQALLTTEEGAKQLTELFEWVNFLYLDFFVMISFSLLTISEHGLLRIKKLYRGRIFFTRVRSRKTCWFWDSAIHSSVRLKGKSYYSVSRPRWYWPFCQLRTWTKPWTCWMCSNFHFDPNLKQ